MKVRLIVFGVTAFWEMPCIVLGILTKTPLCLGAPLMGFCPWPRGPEGSDWLIKQSLWGILSLVAFGLLAFLAIRRNSMLLARLFGLLLSGSSLLVIMRVVQGVVH